MCPNFAGERIFEFFRSIRQYLRPAAANHEFCASSHHTPAHRFAESSAPASNQHTLSLEKIGLEHGVSLFCPDKIVTGDGTYDRLGDA